MVGRICSVSGCSKPHKARGFCTGHYRRWETGRNINSKLSVKASNGAPLRWLQRHVKFDGDDCLFWPFKSRTTLGYPKIRYLGKSDGANRVMCRLAHGKAPSPMHEAAHSCGNGHLGCLNQKHLRWATTQENADDRILHGTVPRGEDHHKAKLTDDDIMVIRVRSQNEKGCHLAKEFDVSPSTISLIRLGKIWRHI